MASFNAIKDLKTRNLVRGLLSKENKKQPFRAIDRIRKECPVNDIFSASVVLHSSLLLQPDEIQTTFPYVVRSLSARPRFKPITLRKELSFQAARVLHSKEQLKKQIVSFATLNRSLLLDEQNEGLNRFSGIIEEFGYSLFLLRKLGQLYS